MRASQGPRPLNLEEHSYREMRHSRLEKKRLERSKMGVRDDPVNPGLLCLPFLPTVLDGIMTQKKQPIPRLAKNKMEKEGEINLLLEELQCTTFQKPTYYFNYLKCQMALTTSSQIDKSNV